MHVCTREQCITRVTAGMMAVTSPVLVWMRAPAYTNVPQSKS